MVLCTFLGETKIWVITSAKDVKYLQTISSKQYQEKTPTAKLLKQCLVKRLLDKHNIILSPQIGFRQNLSMKNANLVI